MLRVSHQGEWVDDADTIEGAREMIRGQAPGRYDVDEIRGSRRSPRGIQPVVGTDDPAAGRAC